MSANAPALERTGAVLPPLARATVLSLTLYCFGHFFIDIYSAALGALQPLLRDQFRLDFTQAGVLGGLLSFSASVLQPVYGYLSDRFPSRMYTALAPAVAGIFISSLGWAPNYWALMGMVCLGGAGIASFHPQGAANATAGVRRNPGRAMAIFVTSGSLGLAVGPAYFSAIAGRVGLGKTHWAAIPGVAMTLLLLLLLPPGVRRSETRRNFDWAPLRAVWKPMALLYALVFIRSIVQVTFGQFLPLYLHSQRGYSLARSSFGLSLFLIAGAIGGFAGGNLADRFGGRAITLISMAGSVPFLALFLFTSGVPSAIGLALGGLILLFTLPVNVVMGQQLAPSQTGTVSALMMGFAWGTAGLLFIPLTGWVSDHFSMQAAFLGLISFPLLGFALALKLPK